MIYVDVVQHYPGCKLRSKYWCHMATDGDIQELHEMAARLGLRRSWFQDKANAPHYDLTPSKRVLALRLGAHSVNGLELMEHCWPVLWGLGRAT